MNSGDRAPASLPSPLRLFLAVLAIVFLAEAVVMVLLPVLLPGVDPIGAAVTDAALLTLLILPLLWWVIVRPLRSSALAEQARAATVVASAMDGIITINNRGLVESFNPAAERIFGYRADEVVDQPLILLIPERYRDLHLRGLERLRSSGESALLGKTVEFSGRRKNSEEFPLELSLASWKTAKDTFYTGLVRDITDRKQAEEGLRLQSTALESAANAILITDREGRITWVNPAFTRLTGYSLGEALHQNPSFLKSEKHDRTFYQNLWETILSGQVWQSEIINRRKDGRLYTEEQTITPVRDKEGRITHFVSIRQDVTERKQVERMKSDFVSFATHQLRTPLAGIKWLLELAGQESKLPDETLSYIQDAWASADRLTNLVNDLLNVSRLESGKLTISPQETDLGKLTQGVLEEVTPLVRTKGHRLSLAGAEGISPVSVDPQLFRQAILNLTSNAIKYSLPGGSIAIRISRDGNTVQWAIQDSGIGIPREAQGRIFEKFYRAENVLTVEPEGTGLGLNLVRLIVERFGGRVWCESEEGKGSTFTFTLPVD